MKLASLFSTPSRQWFGLILGLELLFCLWVGASRRIPSGHEGLTYFLSQYFFLNDTVFSGKTPQWIPYIGHGTVASLWYASQASVGQLLLLPIAPLLKNIPFDLLFMTGVWIDHVILMVGAWLLSGKYYARPATRAFVVLSLTGTVVWASQTWFNFHFYYFLPLILYFLHRFCETLRWRYLTAACHLLALQSLGNGAYFIPVTSFVCALYFVQLTAARGLRYFSPLFRRERLGGFLSFLMVTVVIFGLAAGVLYAGNQEVLHYSYGRGQDNLVPLAEFLKHGGNLNLNKWLELILGLSPALDQTLYMGLLAAVLLIPGARACWRSPSRPLVLSAVILLALSMGSFVSVALYYVWPLMKLYRHLALISPLVKMFMIFIAGFGLEQILCASDSQRPPLLSKTRFLILIFLTVVLFLMVLGSVDPDAAKRVVRFVVDPGGLVAEGDSVRLIPGLPVLPDLAPLLYGRLIKGFFLLVLFFVLLKFFYKNISLLVLGLILVQGYDVYEYKRFETAQRTVAVAPAERGFLQFTAPVYSLRREESLIGSNPRADFLSRLPYRNGSPNAGYNAYAFTDELGSTYLITHLHKCLDRYIRAMHHEKNWDGRRPLPGMVPYRKWKFPTKNPAALKMSGFTHDKIQFFRDAWLTSDQGAAFERLADEAFSGDMLVISVDEAMDNAARPFREGNDRLPLIYKVNDFTANRLEFEVDVPGEGWLYVAQVFSPFWQCFVDGKRHKLYPANLAYQALRIGEGRHHILLRYFNLQIFLQYGFWSLSAYMWLLIGLVYGARCFMRTGLVRCWKGEKP